jgi:hypothetical protein
MLLADGFERAFLGIADVNGETVAVYDAKVCVRLLVDIGGMREDDAVDHFEYNVRHAHVGPHTPVFVDRMPLVAALDIVGEEPI